MEKLILDNKLFKKAIENGYNKISCLGGYWFVITRDIGGINIFYFENDQGIIPCEIEPTDQDKHFLCNNLGEYSNINHPCYYALTELLFNL